MEKGCYIGNSVVDNPTGQYPLRYNPNREWYNGLYHHIVRYKGDQCGIKQDAAHRFTGKLCVAGPNYQQGLVVEYSLSELNCPLDSSMYSFITLCILAYFYVKWRR